eukprot:12420162-Karenia_brevis.AAC.1
MCGVGPARIRTHNSIVAALQEMVEQQGAATDRERRIPEMYSVSSDGVVTEAVMDLVIGWPGAGQRYFVDATVRWPFAARYGNASSVPGEAASTGDADKHA